MRSLRILNAILSKGAPVNDPRTVIHFVNAAHFLGHYAMLIFAAAVMMAPMFGLTYSQLLPYATPRFIACGAGSLVTGWLGDHWSRRHMLGIYFFGLGLALLATGVARTPRELGITLFAIGMFASIYHPVGTAMLVAYADRVGREVGINGVWGDLGVASAALVTGILTQSRDKGHAAAETLRSVQAAPMGAAGTIVTWRSKICLRWSALRVRPSGRVALDDRGITRAPGTLVRCDTRVCEGGE
jgi:MFS family permease